MPTLQALPLHPPIVDPMEPQEGSRVLVAWQVDHRVEHHARRATEVLQVRLPNALDGWGTDRAQVWSTEDWLGWIERTAEERAARRPVTHVSGPARDWDTALRSADVDAIARWLRQAESPDRLAAHHAAMHQGFRLALKSGGIPPKSQDHQPWSDRQQHQEVLVALLLTLGVVPDIGALIDVASQANPRLLQRLLAARPHDLPWRFDTTGLVTPLAELASNEWSTAPEMADSLLAAGVPLDRPGVDDHSALEWAVKNGNRTMVQHLLAHGAQPEPQEQPASRPRPMLLHAAAAQNDPVIIDLLIAAGSPVDEGWNDWSGEVNRPELRTHDTPLCRAIKAGAGAAVERLLAHGATPWIGWPSSDEGSDPSTSGRTHRSSEDAALLLAQATLADLLAGDRPSTERVNAARQAVTLVEQAMLRASIAPVAPAIHGARVEDASPVVRAARVRL